MNPLDYCTRNIRFTKSSDITGAFEIAKYRFLEKPLLELSNSSIKRMVAYKAASCMGTLFLQCALAYRIERELGDIKCFTMTDDDAKQWTITRAKEFTLQLPGIKRLISKEKYAITNGRWLFLHKFVLICGPSESNQQSTQVRFIITDESHLQDSFPDGTLESIEKRMGGKWNRASLHVTTAADAGREIDKWYHEGGQNEFHLRCQNCNELIWMLWGDDSKEQYNGHEIFQWADKQSDTDTLDSLRMICPHCDKQSQDAIRMRYEMQTAGDYVCKNPGHLSQNESYRWNCFAAYWLSWRDRLAEYLSALKSERMGDLQPMADYIKKRLCMSYVPKLHNPGTGEGMRDYKCGDVWIVNENKRRVGSFDVQDAPLHFWAQCDEFTASGQSRRISYCKLESWGHVRQFQLDHNIDPGDTGIDIGHGRFGEVIGKCAEWKWFGLKSGDGTGFDEFIHRVDGVPTRHPYYSATELQDARIGKMGAKQKVNLSTVRRIPPGFAGYRLWSKQNVGMLLLRLKSGASGVYYGIASDLLPDFEKQLHTYHEALDENKKRGTAKLFLKQLSEEDHAFSTASQNLVLAMVAGYFPIDLPSIQENPV